MAFEIGSTVYTVEKDKVSKWTVCGSNNRFTRLDGRRRQKRTGEVYGSRQDLISRVIEPIEAEAKELISNPFRMAINHLQRSAEIKSEELMKTAASLREQIK